MIAERNRIASFKRAAPKNKKEQPLKPKTTKPKPAWDSFLVPDNVYKLKPKEALVRKESRVSKHNIFIHGDDVSIGYRPKSVLRERHPNIITTNQLTSPALKKEKKESDALDLIMSPKKEKDIGQHSVNQKSPAGVRGTSSFAPPSKSVKLRTPKVQESGHQERNDEDNVLLDDLDSMHEFDLSTQLFGQSSRTIDATVSNVVSDNRQRLLQQRTTELAERLRDPSHTFSSLKDTVSSTQAAKSLRTPSPQKHRSAPSALNTSTHSAGAKVKTSDKDYDLLYVADTIKSLFAELKYYEELSGRRSILDTREELDAMLEDAALLDPASHKPVMHSLVQLVCQSMSYLLKSEVDLQQERQQYEALSAQFNTLNALLGEDSIVPGVYEERLRRGISSDGTSGVGSTSSGGVGSTSGGVSGVNYVTTLPYSNDADRGVTSNTSSVENGIAYSEDDLYPAHFTSPVHHTTNNTTINDNTTAANNTNTTPTHTTNTNNNHSTNRHDAPSPSLKLIAQQYAQDDLYPIPRDSEHSVHYDAQYDDVQYEASFVVEDVHSSNVHTTPSRSNNTNTTHTNNANNTSITHNYTNNTNTPTIPAKVTSTPARFHDVLATLSGPEHKQRQLAMNAPPSMLLSTPVRSVGGYSSGGSNVYGNSGDNSSDINGVVNSTARTPQVMPYTHSTRDYTALGVHSTNTTPTNNSSYYTQLNSPAVYVDAYSSYLPSAPTAEKTHKYTTNNYSNINDNYNSSSNSDDVLATPTRQQDPVRAGLSHIDALIEHSRSIAANNTPHSVLGDEFSTIARLSEYKHDANTSNTSDTHNTSMHDHSTHSAYSMHSVHSISMSGAPFADSSMHSVSSVNSVDATPARVRPQEQYAHFVGGANLPPPPPPHTRTRGATSSSTNGGGMSMRQPVQASAARAQLLQTMNSTTTNNTTSNNTRNTSTINTYISSGDSVHSVQSTGSMQGMSGSSASDWLFGAFPTSNTTTGKNNSSNTAASSNGVSSKGGKSVMVGKTLGSGTSSSNNTSSGTSTGNTPSDTTPQSHYIAPTTTMHTIPTTPYTTTHSSTHTTHSSTHTAYVTPTQDVRLANKTHTPVTEDLFNPTSADGFNDYTDRLSTYNTTPTNTNNTTSNITTSSTFNTTTPPPHAAVPTYLLKQESRNKVPAVGLVQVRHTTHRLPSPNKATKTTRIPSFKPEAATIIVPSSSASVPSPHSAPVHPYAMSPASNTRDSQHKLDSLQHHYDHYSNSNATTPTLTLEPWQAIQQRVYDARNGSF